MTLSPKFSENEDEQVFPQEKKESRPFYSFFTTSKTFAATLLLTSINILVFILMVIYGAGFFAPSSFELLKWGADYGPLTLTGDWWRILTCNFVHIGIFHLVMNLYALLFIGVILEPLIGFRRMLAAYLLTGICSAALSLYIHPELVSAGASGSIFGLYGIFLTFLLFHRISKAQRAPLLSSILIFVGYNLLYGMKDGVDNAAHIGGLIGGFLLGLIYVFCNRSERTDVRLLTSLGGEFGILMLLLCCFGLIKATQPDYQDIRHEWDSGMVEAYINGNGEQEDEPINASSAGTIENNNSPISPSNYKYFTDKDTWLPCMNAISGFSCRYPTNWIDITNYKEVSSRESPPLLMLVNGGNQLTITVINYDNYEEFDKIHKLSLSIPRNANGMPSEDYHQSEFIVNGLKMTRTENTLRIGAPDEEGEFVQQVTLIYAHEKRLNIFAIVMLIKDEQAKVELDDLVSTIQLSK